MVEIIETAEISIEETKGLQKTWFGYQAMLDLINTGVNNASVLSEYKKAYAEYNQAWADILTKYFKTNYANEKTGYSWECNFATNVVTITKG